MQTYSKYAVKTFFLGEKILVLCLLIADWTIYNQEEKVSDSKSKRIKGQKRLQNMTLKTKKVNHQII
jgi:hypothetical protein